MHTYRCCVRTSDDAEGGFLGYDARDPKLKVSRRSLGDGGGLGHGKLAKPGHQEALEKSLRIKYQGCPMQWGGVFARRALLLC